MTLRGFLLFILLTLPALAMASGLQLSGAESKVPLANYLESYEDKTAALEIEAITQTEFATSVPPQLFHPGFTKSAIWFKLKLSNAAATPFTRWLSVESSRLQDVSLYTRKNGTWQRQDAGSHIPFSLHPISATNAAFPLQLDAGESATVYLRVASSTAIAIDTTLWEPLAFREANIHTNLLNGLLLGGVALTALFGLLMFVTLKDRAFLLHALTTLAYCTYEISFKGYGLMYLWPDATDWATRSIGLFSLLAFGWLLLFVRDLLVTRTRLPRWDRLLLALLATLPVLILFTLFGDYRATMSFGSLFGTAMLLAIVATTLLSLPQHFSVMRFYTAAFGIMLLGNLARLFSLYGVIGNSTLIEYATPFSILFGNIFMLAAVVERIMLARKEKEAAQQALLAERAGHQAKLELAVEQRTADLNIALTDAHTANQTKSRLLAYISHDLRSPLATIINYVHRLNRHATGEALEYQATIEHCATHQLELIDDLVEYAKGELDHLQLSPVPTYLHAWLAGIAQQTELLAGQYGNRFTLVLGNDIPPVVVFDPKRLRQVLLNLLGNAAKFTAQGDIRLRIQAERLPNDRIALTFAVEDSGAGISPNNRERIFQPFERLESERQGFGLGLSIAQQIVRGMGDELIVDSTPGQGSTFSFRLVLEIALESDIRQPAEAFAITEFFGTGRTILLADDNEASHDYLKEVLSAVNFDVVCAENGAEAWQLLSRQHFDAIIVDQFMPRMGGWELLRKLREQAVTTPIILCSSMPPQIPDGFPQDIEFNATLLKPVSAEKLLQLMHDLLIYSPLQSSAAALASPAIPYELLEQLRDFVNLGSITEIKEWADKLANDYPEHNNFAHRIAEAARRIDLNKLTELLNTASALKS